MIYLGHFSFEDQDSVAPDHPAIWHGYFSCMAEADSVDKALDKFHALLRRLARTSTVFRGVREVYLDSCIEVRSIPKNGFMTYYKESRGECNESISISLIGVGSNHHLAAYQFTEEQCADSADALRTQPFFVFPANELTDFRAEISTK